MLFATFAILFGAIGNILISRNNNYLLSTLTLMSITIYLLMMVFDQNYFGFVYVFALLWTLLCYMLNIFDINNIKYYRMLVVATPICIGISASNAIKSFSYSNSEQNHSVVFVDGAPAESFLLILGLYNGVLVRKSDSKDIDYIPWSKVTKLSYNK